MILSQRTLSWKEMAWLIFPCKRQESFQKILNGVNEYTVGECAKGTFSVLGNRIFLLDHCHFAVVISVSMLKCILYSIMHSWWWKGWITSRRSKMKDSHPKGARSKTKERSLSAKESYASGNSCQEEEDRRPHLMKSWKSLYLSHRTVNLWNFRVAPGIWPTGFFVTGSALLEPKICAAHLDE